jgi:hypothetical protein
MIQAPSAVANWQALYNSWAGGRFGPLQASERDAVSSAKTASDSDPVYRSVAGTCAGASSQSTANAAKYRFTPYSRSWR